MGNYNTKTKDFRVTLHPNPKRPIQIEKDLITNFPKTAINNLIALNGLSKKACVNEKKMKKIPSPKALNKFMEENDWWTFKTQNTLACLVKKVLRDYDRDEEKVPFGDKSLQRIFYPIKELSSGANGVTMITGYKGSEPFAIMKSTGSNSNIFRFENNLHEIVVGLLLNELRKEIPNFMFLYGGFYCAPPLLLQKVFGEWKEREEIQDKIGEIYRMGREYGALEDENYDLPQDKQNPLFQNYKDRMQNFFDTVGEEYHAKKINSEKYIQERINVIQSVLDDTAKLRGDKPKSRAEELLEEMRDRLKAANPEEVDQMRAILAVEPKLDFDESHFCNDEKDKTTLVLYEYIRDATSLKVFLDDDNISREEKIGVMNSLILAYYTAYRKYNFVHHDLHPGNVLVRKLDQPLTTTYKNKEGEKVEITNKYIPIIIDMGMVSLEWNGLRLETLNQDIPDWEYIPAKAAKNDLMMLIEYLLAVDGDPFGEENFKKSDFGEEYNKLLLTLKDKEVDEWFEDVFSSINSGKKIKNLKFGMLKSKLNPEAKEFVPTKSNWEFIIHSISHFNPETFHKIFIENQALIPNENNKQDWILSVKEDVKKSNLSQDIKKIVYNFNVETNLIEEFAKNPSLSQILSVINYKDVEMFPAVYTQYLFKDMIYRGKYWMYTDYKIVLIIDPKILKDKPFFSCKGVIYGGCAGKFEEGFYGKGDGKVDMTKYREHINEKIEKNRKKIKDNIEMYRERILKEQPEPNPDDEMELEGALQDLKFDRSTYELTNEILFDSIPLEYIKAVLLLKNDSDYMDPEEYKEYKGSEDKKIYQLWNNLSNTFSKINGPKVYIIEDQDRDFQTLFNKKGLGKILTDL